MYIQKQLHIPVLQTSDMDITQLITHQDYLKKTVGEQKQIIQELVEREIRHQKFFNFLEVVWRGFLQRNLRIQAFFKNKNSIDSSYTSAFALLDDIFHGQYLFTNNIEGQFKKQISDKFKKFLSIVENICVKTQIQHKKYNEELINLSNNLKELDSDEFDYVRKLVALNKELFQKNQELETNFKEIQKMKEKKINDLDGQIAYQTIFQLSTMVSDYKKQNEILTNRIKILSNNQSLDNNAHKQQSFDDDNFNCICGSFNNDPKKIQLNRSQSLSQHSSAEQKQGKLMQQQQKSSSQQIELLNQQFKKTQEQIVSLTQKCKELEIQTLYREDQFVNSETFKMLKIHNMNLIESNEQLTLQLAQLQLQFQELAQTRKIDNLNLQKYYEAEIQKLSTQVGFLKARLNEMQSEIPHYEIHQSFENSFKDYSARYQKLEQLQESLMNELTSQKQLYKDLRQSFEEQSKQREEIQQKYVELETKHTILLGKIPEQMNLEQVQLRHTKHKEIIVEIMSIITKFQPQVKDKFNELIAYLKSRDGRIESSEKEIQKLKAQIQDMKRHQNLMLEDSDYNSTVFDKQTEQFKMIESQLKLKENNEAQLIQEKIAEKAQLSNEKQILKQKIEEQNQLITRLTNQVNDQQTLIKKYSQEKVSNSENNLELLNQYQFSQSELQKLQIDFQACQIERDSLQKKTNMANLINEQFIAENQKLQMKVEDLERQLETTKQLLDDPMYLEQNKGYLILKKTEDIEQNNAQERIKICACCTQCKIALKEVIIAKCMHMLCKTCGDEAITKEKCPICKISVNISDILQTKIYE